MIKHALFSIDLDLRWQAIANNDPDQFNFRDDLRGITITLSAFVMPLDEEGIEPFTRHLVDLRLRAEDEAATALGLPTTIYEPIVVPRPWGRAVAYYGHNAGGRQFSYSGTVTANGAISLYMASSTLTERELMAAMDEMHSRLEFDRTPLSN